MTYRLTITDHRGAELVTDAADTPAGIIITTLRNLAQHSAGGRITTAVTDGRDLIWICNWDLSEYAPADRVVEIQETARSLVADVHWHGDYATQFAGLVQASGSSENSTS